MASVPSLSAELTDDLVSGNRILFQQKVVDAFGHISVRHDKDPNKYVMSRHLAPGIVTKDDLVTFDLDSNAINDTSKRYYSERYIHGEIYKARPEVMAVVHCHAPQLIPFGITKAKLRPVYHMSAYLSSGVPVFEIRDHAGMTDLLVRTPQLGQALAKSLGDKQIILMRGHGATMVGISVQQVVYRSIYAAQNAALQMEAMRLGEPTYLEPEEAVQAAANNDGALYRPWALWKREIGD